MPIAFICNLDHAENADNFSLVLPYNVRHLPNGSRPIFKVESGMSGGASAKTEAGCEPGSRMI
jgi:hypothetical protein